MLLFDVEADDLYRPRRIHCIAVAEADDSTPQLYYGSGVQAAAQRLAAADAVVAHNGVMFDVPTVERLCGVRLPRCHDTLIWSKYLYPDIYDHPIGEPGSKPNSLESWGKFLGTPKADYGGGWAEYTREMGDYCVQDVVVLRKIWQYLRVRVRPDSFAVRLEHEVSARLREQIEYGVSFDWEAADRLDAALTTRRAALEDQLRAAFPPTCLVMKTKTKMVPFNPRSRQEFARRIIGRYGWKPKVMTPSGQICMDKDVMKTLDFPEAKLMQELDVIDDRAEKLVAWQKAAEADGRVHGWVNNIGAVTHRMSHSSPNLGQVPKVGKPYGAECRACFRATPGAVMVGADLSGVEMRLLAELMWTYDGGEYARLVLDGDPHERNRAAMEISDRGTAKNTFYALIYGAANPKLGKTSGTGNGQLIRDRLAKNLPALTRVIEDVTAQAVTQGYLTLLDGRRAPLRKKHKALNTQIQGNAAVLHKLWFVLCCRRLAPLGVRWLLNVHDELQFECEESRAKEVCRIAEESAAEAGRLLKIKIPIAAEAKVGENWMETH